ERPRTNGRHDHAESSGQGPSKRNGRTPSAVAPDSAENGRQVETTSGSRVSTGRATVQTASTDVPTGADPSEACRVSLRRHPRKLRLTGPAANSIGLEVAGALHETGASLDDMNRFVEPVAARLAAEGIAEGDDALAMARRVRDLLYAARVFWRTDDGVRRVVVAGDDIVTRVLETVASMLVGHHDDPLDPVVIAGLVVPDPQPCHTVVVADAIERGSAGDRRAPEPADVSDADQGGCPTAAAAATAVDGADAPAGGRDEARDPDDAVASMPEVPVAHTAGAGGDPGPATVEPDPAPASEVPNADIVLNDEFRSDADRGVPTAATSPIPDAGPAQVPGQPAEDLSTVDPGVEVSDGGHDRGPSGIVVPAIATFPPSEAMRAGLVPGRGRPGPADIRRLPVANGEAPSPAEAPWAPQPSEGGAPTDAAPGQGPSDTIGDGAMPSVGFPAAPVVAVWAEPNVDPGADGEPPSDAG
ncbi:MAG: hypothetical protein S0880_16035, partial [Actinomycetota bacterium]|nr:hypothetical protein [Actinomycetota bacterium]